MPKRILSGALTIILLLCLLPVTVSPVKAVTTSQQNIADWADYYYDATWVCQQTIRGWRDQYVYQAGETYRMPYGQPTSKGAYIGYGVTVDNFLKAAADKNSVFYTSRSYNGSVYSAYYASDCSAFVSLCWGISRSTTKSIPGLTTYIGSASESNIRKKLQLGDALNSASAGHVVLVTDLIYDNSGNLSKIEITEQTPPQLRRTYYSPAELAAKYSNEYSIYRYEGTVSAAPPRRYLPQCMEYAAYSIVQVQKNVSAMSLPCDKNTNAASAPLATYQVGESLTVTALFINTVNEYWYRIQTGEQTGYIPAKAVEYKKHLTDDFSFTDATIPNAPVVGKSFNMKGVISAKYNAMTSISANILSGFGANGTSITGHKESVNTSVYSLYRSNVDSKTKFGTVPAGKHTYQISVEYQNWYIDKNGEMAANTGALTILEHYFVAVSKSVTQSSCKHSLSNTLLQSGSCTVDKVNVQSCATCGMVDVQTTKAPGHQYNITTQSPTCTESGQTIKVCKICGNKQQETLSQTGHSWSEAHVPGSCISHPRTEYTCDNCGDSYRVYSESLMSDWVESVPQGVPQDMVQEKTQYRFARPTTFQSYELLADEILLSSAWDAGKTISLEYVATWPSGFSKDSDLYQQYNNSPVSSLESDTLRREIHSDKQIGYLYYHWCYNDSFYASNNQGGRYTTFHAYFTETDPSNFDCDTSDGSYNAKHETCANTNWYYVTPVNMQEYTEYQMLYTYRTWEDWSEWSDELPDGDNIKIESRIVYRYVDAAYEPHSYANGVCTVCGANEPIKSPTITLQYPTLLLEDEIKMNVFFTLDQEIDLNKMGMLTWTAKPSVVDISTADAVIPGGTFNSQLGFYGVATEGIPAQNLGDVVYFCIYVELTDGSIVYGKQVQYSPTTYAYNQLNGDANAATKALFVAILNYGSAAQVFLNDTDPLINANLTAEQKTLVEAFRADMVHSVAMPDAAKQGAMAANGGFSSKRPTISLDSAFAINYFFTPSAEVAGDMTFYYWNAADFAAADVLSIDNATGSAVMVNEDGVYGAAIEGIAAKDIDSALYACGVYTDASGNTYSTGILPYSLGFYCGNTAKGEGTLADLAAAIAVYGYYASSYFAQ